MTNHNTLFYNLMKFIQTCGVRFHDIRILATFGWMIVGLIKSKKPHLSHWVASRRGETQAASKERQFARWLHNEKIRPMLTYLPVAEKIAQEFAGQTVYVALDTSQLWKKFVIIRLSLVYRGRALPLGWQVFASGSATVAVNRYQRLLAQVAGIMPSSTKVVLLADRGFAHTDLMKIIKQLGWHFRIRLKQNTWVYQSNGRVKQVKELIPSLGKGRFYESVWITKQQYGPLHLAVAYVITREGCEKWAIISDEPVGRHTFDEYGLRFDIEENFLDDKSGGFNLEDSKLHDSMAISRLCLAVATATLYLVSTGASITDLGLRRKVDTHWRRGLSYLQIGWRWCEYALTNCKWFPSFLWLGSQLDPDLPIASWRQFYRPSFELHSFEQL